MTSPLDGLLALDLSRLLPGPYCSTLLADLGCEVIKVEEPEGGDHARALIPIIFEAFNRNKKSISLNLKHPKGKEAFIRLVEQSDILIEGFRPGAMDRLGLGYETLRKFNEKLIYCAISGYGQDNPYSNLSGHDLNYMAVSGMLSLSGSMDGPPFTGIGLPIADLTSGMFAAIGILAALQMRHKTGKGQFIDVSMTDCLLSLVGAYFPEHQHIKVTKRKKMFRPGYAVFRTKDDKFIVIGAIENVFWNKLVDTLELGDQFSGPKYDSFDNRMEHVEEINHVIQSIIINQTAQKWLKLFNSQDVPCSKVNFLDDLEEDPYIVNRGLIVGLDTPSFGNLKVVKFPLKFSQTTTEIRNSAPRLGEHNEGIFQRIGLNADEISDLKGI